MGQLKLRFLKVTYHETAWIRIPDFTLTLFFGFFLCSQLFIKMLAKTNNQANQPMLPTWLPLLVNGSHTNERTKGTNGEQSQEEYRSPAKYLYENHRVGHRSKIVIFNKF